MSTIAKPRSTELFSREVTSGKRSFFFNVKRAPKGELFFTISELTGKDGVWSRSRVLVPADQAKDFYYGLCEAIKVMREAEKSVECASKASEQKSSASRAPVIRANPLNRATGRSSQGANRQALLAGVR